MTGYVRADVTNQIQNGNIVDATTLDAEYDAVQTAFNATVGHKHDGSVGEGAPIVVLGPGQEIDITSSAVLPETTNVMDLGSPALRFKDGYFAGSVGINTDLAVGGDVDLLGTVVVGDIGADFLPETDDLWDLGSTTKEWQDLWIDGTANIDSLIADTADINGGTIDGVVIGGSVRGAVNATTLNASGNSTLTGSVSSGAITSTGAVSGTSLASSGTLNVTGNSTLTGAVNSGAVTASSLSSSGALSVTGNSTLTGAVTATTTLNVAGNSTLTGSVSSGTITSTGNLNGVNGTLSGTLAVTGNTTLSGNNTINNTVVGTAVQSAVDDATAGRLLKVGAFGLGSTAVPFSGSFDSLSATGVYYTTGIGQTNAPSPTALYTVLHIEGAGSTTDIQLAFSGPSGDGGLFKRDRNAGGSWSPWRGMLQDNGTSGITRGSNTDGEYTRYPDGTQICWHTLTSSAVAGTVWTFPISFSSTPNVQGNGIAVAGQIRVAQVASTPSTTSVTFNVVDGTGTRSANTTMLMATGRWF